MLFKHQAQPKDELYEQPESAHEETSEEECLPISPYTGEPYDPEWRVLVRRYAADPSIISKVKR